MKTKAWSGETNELRLVMMTLATPLRISDTVTLRKTRWYQKYVEHVKVRTNRCLTVWDSLDRYGRYDLRQKSIDENKTGTKVQVPGSLQCAQSSLHSWDHFPTANKFDLHLNRPRCCSRHV